MFLSVSVRSNVWVWLKTQKWGGKNCNYNGTIYRAQQPRGWSKLFGYSCSLFIYTLYIRFQNLCCSQLIHTGNTSFYTVALHQCVAHCRLFICSILSHFFVSQHFFSIRLWDNNINHGFSQTRSFQTFYFLFWLPTVSDRTLAGLQCN